MSSLEAGAGPVGDHQPPVQAGDLVDLTIEGVAHGGHMVARLGGGPGDGGDTHGRPRGFVLFVRHALPGEQVVAQVVDVRRGHGFAEAVEIVRAHPQRVSPACGSFRPFGCGGCDFHHADRALQHELKLSVLQDALIRLGGLEPIRAQELMASGMRDLGSGSGWRTRMRFSTVRPTQEPGTVAMHAHRSSTLIDASACVIADPEVLTAAATAARDATEGAQILVARGDKGPAVVHVHEPDTRGDAGTKPRVRHHLDIHGERIDFRVPVDAFWQADPRLVGQMVEAVLDFGAPQEGQVWWDLYAGAGPLAAGLAVAVRTRSGGPEGLVHAVEGSSVGVQAARRALHDMPWVRIHHQDVRAWLSAPPAPPPTGVVLDPPRSGAGAFVVKAIASAGPSVVIYLACDPMALGRDTATLAEHGYQLTGLRMWDAFAHTHHFETAAVFRREDQIS